MIPSIGSIVLVFADPHHNNGADVAPAIITRDWGDNCVNVRVLLDAQSEPVWLTSVMLYDTREEAMAANAAKWEHVHPESRPSIPFGAFWPPRIEQSHQPGDRPQRF